MPSVRQGSIHLFRLAGVDVSLHWWWFLVAFYQLRGGPGEYSSIVWKVLEYLALFLIVLTHEFGHAMACRQVGGTANHIMLWPFGGVAYVNPPQRPGATLWSIAAGPLVNVVLLPVLFGAHVATTSLGWADTMPDVYQFIWDVAWINAGLLAFLTDSSLPAATGWECDPQLDPMPWPGVGSIAEEHAAGGCA